MADKIAGIDAHKKVLMVVVRDARTPESKPERRRFATMPGELRRLSTRLKELGVEEAVMESTAQSWRSVWLELKGTEWAQAQVDTIRLKLFKVGGSHQRPARVAGTKLHLPLEEHLREGLQRAALLKPTASDQPPFPQQPAIGPAELCGKSCFEPEKTSTKAPNPD